MEIRGKIDKQHKIYIEKNENYFVKYGGWKHG